MTVSPSTTTTFTFLLLFLFQALTSASTVAVVSGRGATAAACGIVAGQATQHVRCFRHNRTVSLLPNISFDEISGGRSFLCGLRLGGLSLLCWDARSLQPKRIHRSDTVALNGLTVGDENVCAREAATGVVRCWRGGWGSDGEEFSTNHLTFSSITCGGGFVCGVLQSTGNVLCWGTEFESVVGAEIQFGFGNLSVVSLVAGESHACGVISNGTLVCRGNNEYGQSNVPDSVNIDSEVSSLALGANFTCAIRRRSGLVACWGDHGINLGVLGNTSFESIVAGLDFLCGLTTSNLSLICWGPGWPSAQGSTLPLGTVAPGPCVETSCGACGTYPDSNSLCPATGKICKPCQVELPFAAPLPMQKGNSTVLSPQSKGKRKVLLAFFVVGMVGSFSGLGSIAYCLWMGITQRKKRRADGANLHERVSDATSRSMLNSGLLKGAYIEGTEQTLGRQKSVASRPETFSVAELVYATENFSLENKVGWGSFGVVYRGRLSDGREVAVKRGHSRTKKSFQEKESAFDSELGLLSRLHHKHLVSLLGFCEESDERLLVYEFMLNGSLHHHLHSEGGIVLSSWIARIKIALEAARGLEYLHDYAVPPIIHRDIKSSNILLDSSWTAKVSDFGLSMAGPEAGQDGEFVSAKAVGTVGYIDPEYYVLNELTAKSDVYGLGVVMLELLTGKRAVFRDEGGSVISVVEYAGRLSLDDRVSAPLVGSEARAVEVLAATAMRCVRLQGCERPDMAEIVAELEKAFALCHS